MDFTSVRKQYPKGAHKDHGDNVYCVPPEIVFYLEK